MTDLARVHLMKIGLTQKELEVAHWVCVGYSNKDISTKLSVTEKTVKFHITNILRKVGVKNRLGLTYYVIKNGGVSVDAKSERHSVLRKDLIKEWL